MTPKRQGWKAARVAPPDKVRSPLTPFEVDLLALLWKHEKVTVLKSKALHSKARSDWAAYYRERSAFESAWQAFVFKFDAAQETTR